MNFDELKKYYVERLRRSKGDQNAKVADVLLKRDKYEKYYEEMLNRFKNEDPYDVLINLIQKCEDILDLITLITTFHELAVIGKLQREYIMIHKELAPEIIRGDEYGFGL